MSSPSPSQILGELRGEITILESRVASLELGAAVWSISQILRVLAPETRSVVIAHIMSLFNMEATPIAGSSADPEGS